MAGSSPLDPAATVAVVPARNLWIIDSWRDLALIVASPVLIIPLLWAAQLQWSAEAIGLFVVAFFATGHHLPTFLRAYGDPELFARYKVRFIVAPIFVITIYTLTTVYDVNGPILVVYFWFLWHGLMQVHGFCRIYDAKVQSISKLTGWIDFSMCLTWFAAGTFMSPGRMATLLDRYYRAGGMLLSPEVVEMIRYGSLGLALAVTVVFASNYFYQVASGHRPSPVKLLMMAMSFGFWWYSSVLVTNIVIGVALFDIFHDVQYFAIVWVFNRKRVDSGERTGAFLKFLFRRGSLLIGLYLVLIAAYGSVSLITDTMIETESIKRVLIGLLIASGVLHFYYDGFIWKVRERSTRELIGLDGGEELNTGRWGLPRWMIHGSKWGLFVVPVVVLGITEWTGGITEEQRVTAIAASVPDSAVARVNDGLRMANEGNYQQAIAEYDQALKLNAKLVEAHYNRGLAHLQLKRYPEAADSFAEALKARTSWYVRPTDGPLHREMATACFRSNRLDEAIEHYGEALKINPNDDSAHFNLGAALANRGQLELAIEHWRQSQRLNPDHPRAAEVAKNIQRVQAASK